MEVAFASDTRSSDCWSVASECGDRVESWLGHAEMIAAECEVVLCGKEVEVKRLDHVRGWLLGGRVVGVGRVE